MPQTEPSPECREVFALLSQYLDLELPPEACRAIESHLQGCSPCIDFVESLRKTVDLCRAYKPEELPKPLEKSARDELERAYRKMLESRRAQGL
jgi:anti-sigma factor RsiW